MSKLYHIIIKETNEDFDYGDLKILIDSHPNIGVSKFTLDRFDFSNKYENEFCIIRKGFLIKSKRNRVFKH